jgi:hypothetical protein
LRTGDFEQDDALTMFAPQRFKLVITAGKLNNKSGSLKGPMHRVRNARVIAGEENRRAVWFRPFILQEGAIIHGARIDHGVSLGGFFSLLILHFGLLSPFLLCDGLASAEFV